jgi:hypothetical protein
MAISILNDLLLFSCLAAVVTGIVIAAASLLKSHPAMRYPHPPWFSILSWMSPSRATVA